MKNSSMRNSSVRIVITGNHLSPALAVTDKLKARRENLEVFFIGRKYPLEGDPAVSAEYKVITQKGIPFFSLTTGRLQRKFTPYTVPSLLKIPIGFFQAFWWLVKFKPKIILSFGGYVSLPVVMAGFILGIPVVIHEQTLGAGLANRIAALFAKKVLISWESSRKFFPRGETLLTGNPVREEIFRVKGKGFRVKDNLPVIYVTGGSLGSHVINVAIEEIIKELLKDYIVIHQTGDARKYMDFERLNMLRKSLSFKFRERYFLIKHVDTSDLGWILDKADLVISRAGANTVSELLALGKPALLIPLPFSSNNEQQENALLFKNLRLGEILSQNELTGEELFIRINEMIKNINRYKKNAEKAKQMIKKDAAGKIKEIVLNEI